MRPLRRRKTDLMSRLTLLCGLAVPAVFAPATAHAQVATAALEPSDDAEPPRPRDVPDYDGRGPVPEDPAEPWLWIPRIATGPLYLVSEYLLRAPLGWFFTELERSGILPAAVAYLSRDFAVVPVALLDLGLRPSVRVFAFWKHALFDANRLDLSAATGGSGLLDARIADTVAVDDVQVRLAFRASRRDDQVFGGIGSGAQNTVANRARFTETRIETELRFDWRFWRRSHLRLGAAYDRRRFRDGDSLGDPALSARQDQLADGRLPAGFAEGYSALRARAELVVDSRPANGVLAGGVRVGAYAEPALDLEHASERRWMRWGGHVTLATDALGSQRVLSLEGDAHLVEDLGSDGDTIPFTELVDPGAAGFLPAYLPGQLRGRSAAALTARYRWPIWVFLDGSVFFSIGSVFGEHFAGFDTELLRYSFGIGVDAPNAGEHPFVFQLAFGSETFANGGEITSFRVLLGARNFL